MGSGAFGTVQAANITVVSGTLSDSAPSASSTHTIVFTSPTSPTGIAGGENITATIPSGFTGIGALTASFISSKSLFERVLYAGSPLLCVH